MKQTGNSKLNARLRLLDWRYRGRMLKKGLSANRYAVRVRQIMARRRPGGKRWEALKKIAKIAAPTRHRL